MKNLKLLIASLSVMVFGFIVVSLVTTATTNAEDANIQTSLCNGTNLVNGNVECNTITEGAGNSINSMVATIINIFSWIVGVICVIMIIYGGFRYVTAGGDSARVGDAKNTILYAIVGLVIVALAQVIVKFVLSKVTAPAA
ncbi:MAG: pilin [Candidatus Saccharibacteria bacterium]